MAGSTGLAYKAYEIEELVDIYFFRRLGYLVAHIARFVRLTPNAVSIVAALIGVAGGALLYWPGLALIGFGLLGYVMGRIKFPTAPLILGFVLGIPMERAIRQSLAMSGGDPTILFERPIPAVLLVMAAIILLLPLWQKFRPAQKKHAVS